MAKRKRAYWSSPHSWLIIGFVTRVTWQVPQVDSRSLPLFLVWFVLLNFSFLCSVFCCLYPISNKDIAVLSLEDQKAPVLNTRGSHEPVFLTWFSIWLLNFIEQVGIFLCNSYVGSRKYFYVCCASSQIKQLYHNKGRFPVKLALVKSAPSQIGLKMKVNNRRKNTSCCLHMNYTKIFLLVL
jgi:hypothetical protein